MAFLLLLFAVCDKLLETIGTTLSQEEKSRFPAIAPPASSLSLSAFFILEYAATISAAMRFFSFANILPSVPATLRSAFSISAAFFGGVSAGRRFPSGPAGAQLSPLAADECLKATPFFAPRVR